MCFMEHCPDRIPMPSLLLTFNHVSSILRSPVGLAVSVNNREENKHVHLQCSHPMWSAAVSNFRIAQQIL